ncbi:response regulator [Candidatus Scalindua japonica]|uniref:response regulator n=1 Tax=Candidatus Scalindua japonica TaxID=1284222 RepID=UPI0013A554DD|nr:response regulator [Candidatus Scalindua japonica]
MSKKILIVEYDVSFHTLYELILDDTDYRIIHAYDENDALAKVEEENPDLIILDILLDMITGDTFFLFLKNIPKYADIPVIIASNYPRQKYKSLKEIDPTLVILDKTAINETLITEINAKIG